MGDSELEFEWDEAKAASNYRKHGVDFETTTEAFFDPFAIEEFDGEHGEERFLITGAGSGALLTVVYTERGQVIRIISARRATKQEHDHYHRENSKG